jgi:AcrR family transcriptional regulator
MGYGGTRLEDIAAEAGISRTTVYHYFPSSRTIFIEVGRAAMAGFREVIDAARATPTGWTGEDLGRLVDAHLRFLDEHGTVITAWTQATWDDPELRDVGLGLQLNDFAVIGRELSRMRGTKDVDPVHEGIVFTGMVERLWFFARAGGAGAVDDTALRRTLMVELEGVLTRGEGRA